MGDLFDMFPFLMLFFIGMMIGILIVEVNYADIRDSNKSDFQQLCLENNGTLRYISNDYPICELDGFQRINYNSFVPAKDNFCGPRYC